MESYCVRCKTKTPMVAPENAKLKNGRPVLRGGCSVCGMKKIMFLKMK